MIMKRWWGSKPLISAMLMMVTRQERVVTSGSAKDQLPNAPTHQGVIEMEKEAGGFSNKFITRECYEDLCLLGMSCLFIFKGGWQQSYAPKEARK